MSYKPETLDPIIFDVAKTPMERGVNFIEASAGTGKTYLAMAMAVNALQQYWNQSRLIFTIPGNPV